MITSADIPSAGLTSAGWPPACWRLPGASVLGLGFCCAGGRLVLVPRLVDQLGGICSRPLPALFKCHCCLKKAQSWRRPIGLPGRLRRISAVSCSPAPPARQPAQPAVASAAGRANAHLDDPHAGCDRCWPCSWLIGGRVRSARLGLGTLAAGSWRASGAGQRCIAPSAGFRPASGVLALILSAAQIVVLACWPIPLRACSSPWRIRVHAPLIPYAPPFSGSVLVSGLLALDDSPQRVLRCWWRRSRWGQVVDQIIQP